MLKEITIIKFKAHATKCLKETREKYYIPI